MCVGTRLQNNSLSLKDINRRKHAISYSYLKMDTISADEIKFKHPFSMLLSGARRTGKTHFVKTLLMRQDEYITPMAEWICWFSPGSSTQNEVFTELKESISNITFFDGLPSEGILGYVREMHPGLRILIIIDDLMEEASKRSDVKHLFTRGRHEDISVIFLTQNAFHKGKHFREMSLNTDYFVIFKNVRDASTISHLASQMKTTHFLPLAYKDATLGKYSYLLLDYRSDTDERVRYRAEIFDNERVIVYQPTDSINSSIKR